MKPRFLAATASAAALAGALLLAGCAGIAQSVPPGTPRAQVIQSMGQPTAVYDLPSGSRLQYSGQPYGRYVYNVDLDAAGNTVAVTQVLDAAILGRVPEDGSWRAADVEREFGKPAFIGYVYSFKGPIWTYRYQEISIPRLFHVYIDPQGVVRRAHATDEPIRPWARRGLSAGFDRLSPNGGGRLRQARPERRRAAATGSARTEVGGFDGLGANGFSKPFGLSLSKPCAPPSHRRHFTHARHFCRNP